jgi:glycylpeptide N-tetradecanoyltransferase
MPAGFEWCSIDILDPAQAHEVYKLLSENYVEDDECMFRFDYSVPFLQWALTPPHFNREWHVGVRAISSGKLMGCITAVPANVRIYDEVKEMVEINFLCVHKKLRTKRLAPVLIKEITRRVNVTGRWQACYTAGVYLPKPIGQSRYYHRSLQPKKLIDIKFSCLPQKKTLASHLKDLKLDNHPAHPLRPMTAEDVPRVHELIQEHFKRYIIIILTIDTYCE